MAKKQMRDLFVKGKPVEIRDGEDYAEVFLRKATPNDEKMAIELADAAKARVLLAFRDKDSSQYLQAVLDADGLTREESIEILITEEVTRKRQQISAELGATDEWAEDNFLEGIMTGWEAEMKERWLADETDVEASRYWDALKKFDQQVLDAEEAFRALQIKDYDSVADDDLLDPVVKKLMEIRADAAWYDVYVRSLVRFGCRQVDDHHEYYFQDERDFQELSEEALSRLLRDYRDVTVDPAEGKDSEEIPTSLESSE